MRPLGRAEIRDPDPVKLLQDAEEERASGCTLSVTNDKDVGEIERWFSRGDAAEPRFAPICVPLRKRVLLAVDCHVLRRYQEIIG